MDIKIKHPNSIKQNSGIVDFPCDEKRLQEICNKLGIEITTDPNCHIADADDKDFLKILPDKICNIDELNYLMKRMDGFVEKEIKQFYASAFAEGSKTMAELINLTFNTHCYSLVSDFSNLNKVGKDLYLNEKQAVATKELEELDGESFAMETIKNNPNPTITPYGVLYKNSNEPYQAYDGRHFPPYQWEETVALVQLTSKDDNEFIYLPCSDIAIQKALMRLEVPTLSDCEIVIDNSNFSDSILDIISEDGSLLHNIEGINKLAKNYNLMINQDIKYFEKLMDYISPKTIDEILLLAETMYEFEIFDGIKNAESYGRYMICESGHFEYDYNLDEYIDFKRYGQEKIGNEVGAFITNGYIVYHGYNQKLSNILSNNFGMVIPKQNEQQILKLYMPLKITTYNIENEYGYPEIVDEPQELSNCEATNYLYEITKEIEKSNLPEEKQRGLMQYYYEHDSVNAKVSKYVFNIEKVESELMGVAVLTLNDNLTPQELEKIKEEITGQASDGYVPKNNM